MKYKARIRLDISGGRKQGLKHSPFMCYMRFEKEEDAYSIRIYFDDAREWSLGEQKECDIEFLHWEIFPKPFPTISFFVFELGKIGEGVFESPNSVT